MHATPKKKVSIREPSKRIDIAFERYRIIAATNGKAFKGIAYVGTEKVLSAEGESQDAVVDAVQKMLRDRMESLRHDRSSGLPGATELFEAPIFAGQRDIERLKPVLKCHASIPDGIADLKDIAHRLRIAEAFVMNAYLSLARKICQSLDCNPEDYSVPPGLTPALVVLRPCEDAVGNFEGYALRDAFMETLEMLEKRSPTLKLARPPR
ncbi:hypothetical protein QWE_20403 [Agrobacterium albertimagni AOL15]|uniref:Uncharacterized protein n=1 Tax=Agrobacterium albertimagni AOL15 TaxID=1156935 RepID=K2Q9J9_9HYPH|nr:hypothetical protein [Agrobacterium albertimagni]EKF57686.1 hypothetical protein QWE_20403 [Agrobacterium albertimagni AOL15]